MSTRHALAFILIAALALLSACGGGNFDEDGRAVPGPVDCKANPQVCV